MNIYKKKIKSREVRVGQQESVAVREKPESDGEIPLGWSRVDEEQMSKSVVVRFVSYILFLSV